MGHALTRNSEYPWPHRIDYPLAVSRNNSMLLLLAILFACALSFLGRHAQGRDLNLAGLSGWVTNEADSLYQMRRVERCLADGFEVAGTDPYLNYPEGSAIPWPPYYTGIVARLVAPFVSDQEAERRATIEEGVGSMALLFGVLTTLVAVLCGALLAGRMGAFVAGTYHALCHISIAYSQLGNGDHHSFVSFTGGALLLLLTWWLSGERLNSKRTSLVCGLAGGVLLGILLGSWLGSMVLLLGLELVLAYLIFRQQRTPADGLATFGFSFHMAALLALWPAVSASPWTAIQPWMLVNLSYFHPAFLAIGALVFVPLFWVEASSKSMKRYPWLVGLLLGGFGLVLMFTDLAVASSIREGFDWASKTNRFMAGINESRSLFSPDASPSATYELGWGLWFIPAVLIFGLYRILLRGTLALLPWVVTGIFAVLQATQQARFAESLALPLAVLLGWACSEVCNWRRWPKAIAIPLVVLLVVLANGSSTLKSMQRTFQGKPTPQQTEKPSTLAVLRAAHWIKSNTPDSGDYSVLAEWGSGHTIEWRADRPTLATNFGSYVGEDSFRGPARFFMSEEPLAAEALLSQRKARYILVDSNLPDRLNSMVERSTPQNRDRWIQKGTDDQVTEGWFRTMGARLMFDGSVFRSPEQPQLDFLRLVYVSPIRDPERRLRGPADISPAAWIWEHVQGAQVSRRGLPGEELVVEIRTAFQKARREVLWTGRATADAQGTATLRVPYATNTPNGEGQVLRATWRMGAGKGPLLVAEKAVQNGLLVEVL